MRDHLLKTLPAQFQGIVAFPSFHTLLAVLSIVAAVALPSRILAAIIIAINVVMILSTPVDGGHYLVDTLSGLLLGVVMVAGLKYWPKVRGVGGFSAQSRNFS